MLITSPANPRVKEIRKLRDRKEQKRTGLFYMEGLRIIGLPKTIDNDLWATELTFGFPSAVDAAAQVLERVRSTYREEEG